MAKTYLEIVNIVLRDINEVPLTEGTFATARGLQAFTKEAVNRSLLDIMNYNDEWTFQASDPSSPGDRVQSHIISTVDGTSEYSLAAGIDQIDWDNVLISDPTEVDSVTKLEFVAHNQITKMSVMESKPKYVYRTPNGTHLGLYPRPDDVFTIEYLGWDEPTLLTLFSDTIPFEDRYYTVLVSRARYYLWMFRENSQQASMALNEYEENIRMMFRNLMNPATNRVVAV